MFGLEEPPQTIDTYYYEDLNYSPVGTGNENVTEEGLTITVTRNSSLYVCFNCYVYQNSGMTEVRLYINDVGVSGYMRVYSTVFVRTPMTLQYFDDVIEPYTESATPISGTIWECPQYVGIAVQSYMYRQLTGNGDPYKYSAATEPSKRIMLKDNSWDTNNSMNKTVHQGGFNATCYDGHVVWYKVSTQCQ